MSLKVYLAGPDVFLDNAHDVLSEKARLATAAGFDPIIPEDLNVSPGGTRIQWGMAISQMDEQCMQRSNLIVANLTPFRGVSADAGTIFELAFMAACGKPVYGYSNSARSYLERNREYYGGNIVQVSEERWSAPDGTQIENFEMAENLMIDGAILSRNGVFVTEDVDPASVWSDLRSFKRCLEVARKRLIIDRRG